jgi:hypothetical protein
VVTNNRYSVEEGQLIVREQSTDRVVRRQTFEVPVLQVLTLPGGDGYLVLLDFSATKKPTFENLFKVGTDGAIVWKAELPRSPDAFVSMRHCGKHVEAQTWNGYRVEIDLESGRATNTWFVK